MINRNSQNLTSPHPHPASFVIRYFEELMSLTHKNPLLMKDLVYVMGASSLALAASPWVLPALGYDAPVGTAAALTVGAAGSLLSFVSGVAQHSIFGFPIGDSEQVYKPCSFSYETANGEISIDDKSMPILRIKADDHFDAGYVEGYLLADGIRVILKSTDVLYPMVRAGLATRKNKSDHKGHFSDVLHSIPKLYRENNTDLKGHLADILKTIPKAYQDEMLGKVAGYNAWLSVNHPNAPQLTYERYLLLQLMPDIRNYNPFPQSRAAEKISSLIHPQIACTTIALRLGDYTFFTRVLDWPSHGVAGKYFIQVDRNISGFKRTVDIGSPLISGALTVLNEDGLLVEMNVAHGDKVLEPEGMPAIFFNRYCAENAASVADIERLVAVDKPVGAYHLTATDGGDTQSFHFYQSDLVQGNHAIDILPTDKALPQLLVVANNGLQFEDDAPLVINHRDSNERKKNIYHLFNQESSQQKFMKFIRKQEEQHSLSREDILDLKEFCLQVARLPLVSNCESVLCAIYVYHHHQLIDASAATDNLYAQEKELDEFKQLNLPEYSVRH